MLLPHHNPTRQIIPTQTTLHAKRFATINLQTAVPPQFSTAPREEQITQVLITQNLENGNTRHFHGNMYTHHAKGYIEIYGVTEWAPAYWDSNNVHVESKPHNKVMVKPIMVLPYDIPRDEQPTELFDQLDLLPDAEFAHSNTGPANTTLIHDIMKNYTSDMALL